MNIRRLLPLLAGTACFAVMSYCRAAAAADTCPRALMLESGDGHSYVAAVGADSPQRVAIRATVYAKSGSFVFDRNDVAIDTQTLLDEAPYRSSAIVFQNPGSEPLLGASLKMTPADGALCPDVHLTVPPVHAVTGPARPLSSRWAAVKRAVNAEASTVVSPVVVQPNPESAPLACEEPFSEVTVLKAFQPTYPLSAQRQGHTGMAIVKTTVDASGAVTGLTVQRSTRDATLDAAALEAARRTTYRPQSFACRPEAGEYNFRADFTGRY